MVNSQKQPLGSIGLVWLYGAPLFLLYLADGILSYIYPVVVEESLGSNTLLGLVMAFSSLVGLACDILIPLLFPKWGWRPLFMAAVASALVFPFAIQVSAELGLVVFFLVASGIWGIYYEFILFSQQEFVSSEGEHGNYSKTWGLIYLLGQLSRLAAPLIGAYLIIDPSTPNLVPVSIIQIAALLSAFAFLRKRGRKHKAAKDRESLPLMSNLRRELHYWRLLSRRIYPVIANSFVGASIDAMFWTTGALFGAELFSADPTWDWLLMFLYSLALLLGLLTLTRVEIKTGKKLIANLFLLSSGLLFAVTGFLTNPYTILGVLFCASLLLSVCGPLNDAVFSDLIARLGKKRTHLLGLTRLSSTISYIFAPLLVGWLADTTGYQTTFSILGIAAATFGALLLLLTPEKLKLPQAELV